MTENQIEFLLDRIFHTSYSKDFPGWKTIATKLIKTGECIIAGQKSLWPSDCSEVGKFIGREDAPNAVGCSLLKFDLNKFIEHSEDFHRAIDNEIKYTEEYIEGAKTKLQELRALKDGNETEKTLR